MSEAPESPTAESVQKWPLEDSILERVCAPTERRIPDEVSPNTLSWLGHLMSWTTFILAAASLYVSRELAVLVLFLAGVSAMVQMMLDNMDGMHARRTRQCSKFGEFLDHWLDAMHIPLTSAAIAMALGVITVSPWLLVGVQLTAAMIYNAQQLLYHQEGRFIHPPTSGTVAQFVLALWFVALGPYFYFFPRTLGWNQMLVFLVTSLAILSQTRQTAFYWRRLKRSTIGQWPYLVSMGGFAALYIYGGLDALDFVLASVFVSFRINGNLVLHAVLKKEGDGRDYGVIAWPVLLFISFAMVGERPFGPLSVHQVLVYVSFAYMLVRSIVDAVRSLPAFRVHETSDAHAASAQLWL